MAQFGVNDVKMVGLTGSNGIVYTIVYINTRLEPPAALIDQEWLLTCTTQYSVYNQLKFSWTAVFNLVYNFKKDAEATTLTGAHRFPYAQQYRVTLNLSFRHQNF